MKVLCKKLAPSIIENFEKFLQSKELSRICNREKEQINMALKQSTVFCHNYGLNYGTSLLCFLSEFKWAIS